MDCGAVRFSKGNAAVGGKLGVVEGVATLFEGGKIFGVFCHSWFVRTADEGGIVTEVVA